MGLREQKKAQVRAQLHGAAMALFEEHGYEGTRIRDIIERVGVSEATFFNYFPTKESLLEHAATQAKDFYGVLLHHLVARGDEPAADRVRELVRTVGSVFVADRTTMTAVVGRTSLFYGASGAVKQQDVANHLVLAELFRQGQATGEIGAGHDPLQLAEVISSILILTITNWAIEWFAEPGELLPRLDAAVDVFLGGCLRPSSGG